MTSAELVIAVSFQYRITFRNVYYYATHWKFRFSIEIFAYAYARTRINKLYVPILNNGMKLQKNIIISNTERV